jgi:hypothetical protein
MGLLLSGCASVKIMVGVDEPDLAEIKTGVPRSAVEKILGKRLWHVGVSAGLSYDIYQYEQEQPPRPGLGVAGLGLEFLYLGSPELETHPRDFGDARQVAVAYDNQDQVAFVSKPWPVQDVGPCRRQRDYIPKDSGVPADALPGPLNGLSGTALTIAILDDDDFEVETIDGHVPEENVIELLPGHHEVGHHGYLATIEFFPGRHYRMEHESFYGVARYRPFIFIEDVDSRETMLCLKPWGLEY